MVVLASILAREVMACCANARAGGSTILVGRCSASVSSACRHELGEREQLLSEAGPRLARGSACCASPRAGGSTILVGRCSAGLSRTCRHKVSVREQLLPEANPRIARCSVSEERGDGLLRECPGWRQHRLGGQVQRQRVQRLLAQACEQRVLQRPAGRENQCSLRPGDLMACCASAPGAAPLW